jgi:hypothetical protein
MTRALATADGWRATGRAVAWPPLLALCASGPLIVVAAWLVGDRDRWAGLAEWAMLLVAVAVAFAADDAVATAAPASPTGTRPRLAARACVVVPVVAVAWLVVALGYGVGDLLSRAWGAVGAAAVSMAIAVAAGRRWPAISPGAAGSLIVVGGLAAFAVAPSAWIGWLPDGVTAHATIAAVAAAAVVWGTREPAR